MVSDIPAKRRFEGLVCTASGSSSGPVTGDGVTRGDGPHGDGMAGDARRAGDGGATDAGAGGGGAAKAGGGCDCELPPQGRHAAWLVLVALALARVRRRPR